MNFDPARPERDPVGLCRHCAHVDAILHPRGGPTYWRCRQAAVDPRLRKYPVLPVRACPAFRPAEGDTG